MRFQKLEHLKAEHPYLSQYIDGFDSLLYDLIDNDISVQQVVQHLQTTPARALVLLGLAEDLGLLNHSYLAYAIIDDWPLGEFKALDEIPDPIEDERTAEFLYRDEDYLIDLVFRVNKSTVEGIMVA